MSEINKVSHATSHEETSMFENEDQDDEPEKYNPWDVNNLDDFIKSFYCCPECPNKSENKAQFINHALVEHPRVSKKLIELGSSPKNSQHLE